jgi:hypothetical protein
MEWFKTLESKVKSELYNSCGRVGGEYVICQITDLDRPGPGFRPSESRKLPAIALSEHK